MQNRPDKTIKRSHGRFAKLACIFSGSLNLDSFYLTYVITTHLENRGKVTPASLSRMIAKMMPKHSKFRNAIWHGFSSPRVVDKIYSSAIQINSFGLILGQWRFSSRRIIPISYRFQLTSAISRGFYNPASYVCEIDPMWVRQWIYDREKLRKFIEIALEEKNLLRKRMRDGVKFEIFEVSENYRTKVWKWKFVEI